PEALAGDVEPAAGHLAPPHQGDRGAGALEEPLAVPFRTAHQQGARPARADEDLPVDHEAARAEHAALLPARAGPDEGGADPIGEVLVHGHAMEPVTPSPVTSIWRRGRRRPTSGGSG